MPWESTPEKRARDAETYGDPLYRKNRAIARRQAGGRCARCQHRHARLECDHIIPKSQGGGNALSNLQMLCSGEGTCRCHDGKTYGQRGGLRSRGSADPEPRPPTRW